MIYQTSNYAIIFKKMDLEEIKKELLEILYKKSFILSSDSIFVLSSGRKSNYYIDCKKTTLSPKGAYLIGNIIFEKIKEMKIDGIGGLTLGADPIALSVSLISYINNHPIPAFVVRKEPKSHGTIRWIEGDIKPGGSVVVLDDVITSGSSTMRAIRLLEEEGFSVAKVIALVDRKEGARRNIERMGLELEALFTVDDLMEISV